MKSFIRMKEYLVLESLILQLIKSVFSHACLSWTFMLMLSSQTVYFLMRLDAGAYSCFLQLYMTAVVTWHPLLRDNELKNAHLRSVTLSPLTGLCENKDWMGKCFRARRQCLNPEQAWEVYLAVNSFSSGSTSVQNLRPSIPPIRAGQNRYILYFTHTCSMSCTSIYTSQTLY